MAQAEDMARLIKQIASDTSGLLRLIQAIACVRARLLPEVEVSQFFVDLLTHCIAVEPTGRWKSTWWQAWDVVARGVSPHVVRPGGHVRRLPPPEAASPPAAVFTTIINEDDWHTYHLAGREEDGVDLGLPLPAYPIGASAERAQRWFQFLQRGHWSQPASPTGGAWLGRPAAQNANCWVSCSQIADGEPLEQRPEQLADLLDALGLTADHRYLAWLQYTVHPNRMVASGVAPSALGARPGFADLGSAWFRVESSGLAAQRHQRHGWGSTVNLAGVRRSVTEAIGAVDDTGLPERVISAVPVDSPAVDLPSILPARDGNGPAMNARHTAAFLRRELGLRNKSDIVRAVLEIVRGEAGAVPTAEGTGQASNQ